jgi:pimeloyl-ACP methyl ester carboxylesterase/DNA-binding CsgD family transcriptional regulator
MISQQVRFCNTQDGVRIAYAVTGSGPVLLRAPHFLTHIDYDWRMPVRRHWIETLAETFKVVRFDPRGCGLSDRAPPQISLELWVNDLEAVVAAAGLTRFTLFGPSQGGAVAMEYAVRHPERVDRLVLFGAFARGKLARKSAAQIEDANAQLKLVELGWGSEDPTYRQVFASQMMPGASPEDVRLLAEMMRLSTSPSDAARLIRMFYEIDVVATARKITCPTLLFHARHDRRVPYEEGLMLASMIPGARLVTLETINHMPPPQDPVWPLFLAELRTFLAQGETRSIAGLTQRELEVLEQLARGLDNRSIAERMGVTEKTVRNHLTRVFEKIRVHRRGEAIVWAREAGLGAKSAAS